MRRRFPKYYKRANIAIYFDRLFTGSRALLHVRLLDDGILPNELSQTDCEAAREKSRKINRSLVCVYYVSERKSRIPQRKDVVENAGGRSVEATPVRTNATSDRRKALRIDAINR